MNNCCFIDSLIVYFITATKVILSSLQIYASSLFAFRNILLSMMKCLISQIIYFCTRDQKQINILDYI